MNLDVFKTRYRYDYTTGKFFALRTSGRKKAGEEIGWLNTDGYLYIAIDGKKYSAHRLAWYYVHGEWPKKQIDHINRNKLDNRICNLRDVRQSVNARNRQRLSGAYLVNEGNSWSAKIGYEGAVIYLGQFAEKEHAEIAYIAACRVVEAIDALE